MAATIRYVALKPLPLQDEEGGRLLLAAGDEIPTVMHGRWVEMAVEAGKVAVEVAPAGTGGTMSDDELVAELRARGYRVSKPKAA